MKRKRIVSLMLVALMIMTLVGCGDKNSNQTYVPNSTNNTNSTEAATTTENDTTAENNTVVENGNKGDAVVGDQSGVSGPSDDEPTKNEDKETEKNDNSTFLSEGPKNPTSRKMYIVSSSDYDKLIKGLYSLDKLCVDYKDAVVEEKIQYTDKGYIVTSTTNDTATGQSLDCVDTYNDRGEIVHVKKTMFNSTNPNGIVYTDANYVQNHFNGGVLNYKEYTTNLKVTSDGKIESGNAALKSEDFRNNALEHECHIYYTDVIHEENRTIFYNSATCDAYDVENRKNYTVIESGEFEVITYNSDGKIESICHNNQSLNDGRDYDGNTYTSIQKYVDYAMANDKVVTPMKWTYDKNGNVLVAPVDYNLRTYYRVYVY